MHAARLALAAFGGYLVGSVPSADLAARAATRGRVDLREVGTGNPGATNAAQVLGTRWGLAVLAADVGKGAAGGVLGSAVAGPAGAYVASTAAVAGHIAPVWKRFRGGKGVATSAGACLAVFPAYFLIDLGVAVAGATRLREAERATQVSCAVWVVAALVWWWRRWPNAWGPTPSAGLPVSAAASSAMILAKFASARRTQIAKGAPR